MTFQFVSHEIFAPCLVLSIIFRTRKGATVSASFARMLKILISCPECSGSFLICPMVRSVITMPGLMVPTITGPPLTSAAKASVKYLTAFFEDDDGKTH